MDTTTESGFDLDAAVEEVGASLFPTSPEAPDSEPTEPETPPVTETDAAAQTTTETPTNAGASALEVPKSWRADMHPYWQSLDPKVQAYYIEREKQMLDGLDGYKTEAQFAKSLKEALTPYQQTLKQLGVDEIQAAKSLFQADHLLRYSTPEQKRAYFEQLAKNYGIELGQTAQPSTPVDPVVQSLQAKLQQIEQTFAQQQDAATKQAYAQAQKDLDAFAADPAHPHFNAVADDMVTLLKTGLSLQDAYERAVWMNPVVREQQVQARLQTEAEKQKERARLEALPKAKAAKHNVRSIDTKRTPTDSVGTMEDTLKDTLAALKARAS